VRGASRVVRARALDTLDTSPGALVSPARSVRGINHTRYTGYSSFFKNLEVHNTWCVAGGARPCTRHLLYLTPGAGFSQARSGRGTQSCFNHTLQTGYSSFFKKNLEVQRARPVTRGRVPDTTEWGASRVVRGASRVVRACALDTLDTSPGAVVSPARSVRGINHTRYTGYSSFFFKPRSSQHVVRRGWCAPLHSTPAIPDTWRWVQPSSIRPRHTVMFQSHTTDWIFELFLKKLEVQRARPVTRGRVPDTTEWGALRVVRGARCVAGGARPCTRHP